MAAVFENAGFSHYPAVGPSSNTVKLDNHHSNSPQAGIDQKNYLNTYILDLRRKAKPYS